MPLKITKRKGSDYWYVRGTVKGQEVFESTRTADKTAADRYRLQRENELNVDVGPNRKTFTEACIAYIQKGGEQIFIERLDAMLGGYYLDEIDQNILDTKAREAYPTQSNSTVRRSFYDPFTAVRNHAARLDWIPHKVFVKPKVKRPPPDWVEIDWLEKLWEQCPPNLLALMTFMPYTGCRSTECTSLTWDKVNLDEAWAYIPKTKNGEPRTVHLPEIVVQRLRAIQEPSGRVFGYSGKDSVRNAVKRACERAGIEYKRPHAIGSHTYATWMRRYNGMDAVGLVATGRWKDPRSTYIYAHANTSEEARKADNLPTPSSSTRA